MLRSGGEAIRYAHDHGLRRAARKFFRTYIFARHRVYLTHNDLIRIAAQPLDTNAFEVRLARPDDALAEAFPHLKRSTIAAWLRPDHFFFVLLLEGTLVGYRCLSTRPVPSLKRFLRLRSHQLFAVNMYTRPEHRRRGFTRIAKIAAARDLVRRGFLETFATEAPTNYSTLIANPRTGSLRIGTLTRTCTLGWARFALTPTTIVSPPLVRRQLALLKRVAPPVSHAGVLFNPSVVLAASAAELETEVTFLPVREAADQAGAFNEAFSTARAAGVNGLIVLSDP